MIDWSPLLPHWNRRASRLRYGEALLCAERAFALIVLGFTRLSAPAGGVGPVKRMILSADLTAARRGMTNLLNLSTGSVRNEIESLARKLNVAV